MRAKELFNKLTLGNKLMVVGMALSLCSAAHSTEIATVAPTLTPEQFNNQRCDAGNANWMTSQTDFTKACAKAGLGGNEASCRSKLEKCESSSDKYSYCIGSATSSDDHRENVREKQDQERELQERKDALIADYQEKQTEIQRAKENQDLVQQELQATLTGIDNKKTETQLALENELINISAQTSGVLDLIDDEQLKLREFVLNNELKCREKALEEKNRYVASLSGVEHTFNNALGRAVLTNNQAGSIRYEQVVRNCTALYTSTGKITGFGSQYRLQSDVVANLKKRHVRSMILQEEAKQRAARNTRIALSVMDEQKKVAMINAQVASARATQNVQLLESQRNEINAQITQLSGKMNILGREVSTSQVMAAYEIGRATLTGRAAAGNDPEKVAKQERIEAFNTAMGLKDSISNAEREKDRICETQQEIAEVVAARDAANDEIDISAPASATTATATEIDISAGRTPATSAGETL
jgi:hypothetical protein